MTDIPKHHYCEEMEDVKMEFNETEISIAKMDGRWVLYLFDGEGVTTRIRFCPYCSETLV